MKLLFVTKLDAETRRVYTLKWRPEVKLLFVSNLDPYARAVSTITRYVQTGEALGHEVAVFGEQRSEPPAIPCSLDASRFDFVIFVIYQTSDFPDLPHLAQLVDGVPKERRIVIDCCGRFNETIRVEHDFNHLEKLDGHQGWEWIEGFEAISSTILQPTLKPLRSDVRPFLFHGYDPSTVVRPYISAGEASRSWSSSKDGARPYGIMYVGNNWQRWSQIASFLQDIERVKDRVGPICLIGWDWSRRPDWAVELGLEGADVDPELLARLSVETRDPIPFDEVISTMGSARFSPIFHRPLFKELGLVTNRTFETFCADTIPLIMLPEDQVEAIYGPQARPLAPGEAVADRVDDMLRHPEAYWEAVLGTRDYLAAHHSYERRFEELMTILET